MFGYSDFSNQVTILAAAVPDPPVDLASDADLTDETQITVTWNDGASDGGSPILDYRVQYDQANGNWIEIATGV